MKKSAVIAIVAIGAGLSLVIRFESQAKFHVRDALWREQQEQLTALNAEHQRLSNLVANAATLPRGDHATELTKLRQAAEALKKQTNDFGRQLAANRQSRRIPPVVVPESHPPEYWKQLHEMAGGRSTDAHYLDDAFYQYAYDHGGLCPANLDLLAPYLAKENQTLTGTNQFEIVYQGSIHQLDGIPPDTVAVIRDQQTWPGPDGRATRVYGLANGVVQLVSSDDNFQAWEAEHTIPPPGAALSGK